MLNAICHISSNQPHTFNTNWFTSCMGIRAKKEGIRGDGVPRISRAERAIQGKDICFINVMYPFCKRRMIVVLSRKPPDDLAVPITSDYHVNAQPVNWFVAAEHNNDFYETVWFCNLIGVKSAPRKAHIELHLGDHTWFSITVNYYSSRQICTSPHDVLTFYCKAYEIPY